MQELRSLKVLLFLIFALSSLSSSVALTLSNIKTLSDIDSPYHGVITLISEDKELPGLVDLRVVMADDVTYNQYGIKRPDQTIPITILVKKDEMGVPTQIDIESKKDIISPDQLFNDLILQLKWSAGSMERVYTILNTNAKTLSVKRGDTLTQIALKVQPTLVGATFEQTLTALFRANPQAFVGGNINRLKVDDKFTIPSKAMVTSIPQAEAQAVYLSSADSNNSNQSDRVANKALFDKTNPIKNSSIVRSNDDSNRLKITNDKGPKTIGQIKNIETEKVIAEQKLLQEAQQRIAEIQKNVEDLQKVMKTSPENIVSASLTELASMEKVKKPIYSVWTIPIVVATGTFFAGLILWLRRRSVIPEYGLASVKEDTPWFVFTIQLRSIFYGQEGISEKKISKVLSISSKLPKLGEILHPNAKKPKVRR
jgi:pilus assembly protein FimV